LQVPEGARLVGTAFPLPGTFYKWTAVLLFDAEDPFPSLRRLMAEARSRGFSYGSGDSCDRPEDNHTRECFYGLTRVRDRLNIRFELFWSDRKPYRRHLVVTAADGDSLNGMDPTVVGDVRGIGDAPAWTPPAPGSEIAGDLSPERPGVRVVEGTTVVAPPAPGACITGGYRSVLRAERNLRSIVESYARQFERERFDGTVSESRFRGEKVVTAAYEAAGGGDLTAVAISDSGSDHRGWVLVSRCND
jgi:hypothetical protein